MIMNIFLLLLAIVSSALSLFINDKFLQTLGGQFQVIATVAIGMLFYIFVIFILRKLNFIKIVELDKRT